MSFLALTNILSLLLNTFKFINYCVNKFSVFVRNVAIRKKYKKTKRFVKDGNIDELNEIFRK